jgi:large subunit ribosomal protein L22
MPGVKTNEIAGTRAVLRHYRMSATKARQVLDLVRGKDVDRAAEILAATPREGARVVAKVLASAVANARNNDFLDPDDLYVSACYADEGTTIKRWRPRARGRATRIRKRTCHITVIVSRLPEERLVRRRARQAEQTTAVRSRRVAASRRGGAEAAGAPAKPAKRAASTDVDPDELETTDEVIETTDTDTGEDTTSTEDTATDEVDTGEDADAEDIEAEDTEAATADAEEKD